MKLGDMAKLIRSKNAGPFMLTIDILFDSKEAYETVKNSKNFNVESIARLYQLNKNDIRLICCDPVHAFKISFHRPVSSGGLGDTDVFGGQQHGPLVDLEVLV